MTRQGLGAWLAGLWLAAPGAPAAAADLPALVVAVDTSTEMPLAEIRGDQLLRGLHRDLGEALARQLGRRARFLVLPRKRIAPALETGEAELLCFYRPAWLPGDFDWSRAFLPNADLLITPRSAAQPQRLDELAGQAIGTLHGFAYPALERALGAGFVREDAPHAQANLRKLVLGRTRHAVVNQLFLDYQRRGRDFELPLHPPLVLEAYQAQCALSRHSSLKAAALERAIAALLAEGLPERLLARYR